MRDSERGEAVAVALEHVAGLELADPHVVAELPDDAFERAEQIDQPSWPVDLERQLAPPEGKGLEHPGKPEDVVGVEVSDEDLL